MSYLQVTTDEHDPTRHDSKSTYYIVPPGMNVIFLDKFGNELTR